MIESAFGMFRPQPFSLHLASGSPRRRELLELTGWRFTQEATAAEESGRNAGDPQTTTWRLASSKARAAAGRPSADYILAADTLVIDGERRLGKPADAAEAERMLLSLAGREHSVVTSLVILETASGREIGESCASRVPMRNYSKPAIRAYVASGSPFDKAGAYGIQDQMLEPVDLTQMQDCYANVMGLPLCHLVRAMRRLGAEPPADVPGACQAHTGYDCPIYARVLDGSA